MLLGLEGHPRTRVELCGRLVVEIEGRQLEAALPGRQGRLLFAFLVLHRARPVRRDELVAALWPERPPAAPDDALNTLVSRLRKVLGEDVLRGRSELALELPIDAWVDVESASEQIQLAERALERGDWQEAESAAGLALGVAERGFLAEVEIATFAILIGALLLVVPPFGTTGAAVVGVITTAAGFVVLAARTRKWLGGRLADYLVPTPADAAWLVQAVRRRALEPRTAP